MASPFPGMDPYLESRAFWPDFHWRFVNYWCEAVADALPARYSARMGERVYEEVREPYIEILHRPDRTLIAVLELLSPANKEQPGRGEDLAKRNRALRQEIHVIELDLLLKGQRPPFRQPLPAGDYYYVVARAERRPDSEVYSWTMRQPLPTVPVPLRSPDLDIAVDLAAVFAIAYQRGYYEQDIDYQAAPPVSLSAEQRAWVAALLKHEPA